MKLFGRSMGSSTSSGYPASQHHFSAYSQYGGGSNSSAHGQSSSGVVELPPKIDRSSKPRSLARSAQERLFGSREGDVNGLDIDTYPTSPPGPAPAQAPPNGASHPSLDYLGSLRGSSLDRERAAKAVRRIDIKKISNESSILNGFIFLFCFLFFCSLSLSL